MIPPSGNFNVPSNEQFRTWGRPRFRLSAKPNFFFFTLFVCLCCSASSKLLEAELLLVSHSSLSSFFFLFFFSAKFFLFLLARRKITRNIIRTPRTPVLVRVSQTLQVTILGSFTTSPFTPRTSVFVRVSQTLQVTIFGSPRTNPSIPPTPVFVCIFQTLEVTTGNISQVLLSHQHPFSRAYFKRKVTIFDSIRQRIQGQPFRARISNTRGDHFGQPKNHYFYPKDIRFPCAYCKHTGDHVNGSIRTSLHFIPRTAVFVRSISNTRV